VRRVRESAERGRRGGVKGSEGEAKRAEGQLRFSCIVDELAVATGRDCGVPLRGEAEAMGAKARATTAREAMQLLMEGMAE
jgi:hypothetical protein